eukprot:TRINITY_DN16751_c0_g1_i2.p1 TRINITY_DN16751_c0_g1~~TRINITY_DN16751_c0_g1_i2.p1  ORF type:complete len:192 (-),score=33.12 TRINITY_DN16751_c0_g1_i2:238-813(-)
MQRGLVGSEMCIRDSPNIIRLHDTFETTENILIVMDLLKGRDLYEYLDRRQFKISESRACNLVHYIATALYYLHSYGIVHRDIKLDNILMVDDSDECLPKLVDFGLSKMIGPNETCCEPFGTIGFVAPEVLLGKPYNKSVDIWGLGVVSYLLLVGKTPFEDEGEPDEEKIAKNTVSKKLDFDSEEWKKFYS